MACPVIGDNRGLFGSSGPASFFPPGHCRPPSSAPSAVTSLVQTVPDSTFNPAGAPRPATAAAGMTPLERRASLSLAGIFALRMLGLFLVLPVFALEARKYPGGDDPALVGLAMGIYGLTQAFLQMPFGIA